MFNFEHLIEIDENFLCGRFYELNYKYTQGIIQSCIIYNEIGYNKILFTKKVPAKLLFNIILREKKPKFSGWAPPTHSHFHKTLLNCPKFILFIFQVGRYPNFS